MDMSIQFELSSFCVLRIFICSLIPIVIEMDNAARFAFQRENNYYYGSSDTNRDYVRMKLIIYK
jgi:hypothetical protein